LFGVAKLLDRHPRVGPTDDRADGNGDNVEQVMLPGAVDAQISQIGKRILERVQWMVGHSCLLRVNQ
jgi:hypothetical protein